MYFKALPKLLYPFNNQKNKTIMPDIFRRVHLDENFKNKMHLITYYIGDNETPEFLAEKFYNSTEYHWVILLVNEIVDVKREWPMAAEELVKYCKDKYGVSNTQDIHHWVLKEDKSVIVDWDAVKEQNNEISSVTNFDYELAKNEAKREIYLLDANNLKRIEAQYKKLVK
tara:strand:+ start:314 stop:823 length:510 start_codon:yes stop_codon:yes gene_type:complete